ncbi:hypothetical protein HDU86_000314 [Geranomyces michiganensis]|nr:hypothetical protein HDU86_000314 [Geranomyces michiganensis]
MADIWASSGDPFASSPSSRPGAPSPESPGGFPLSADETAAYAHLYKLADPQGKLTVQPQEAVTFLSKSRLPQNVLSEIWQQADSDRKGYLTQADFWKSLKMIALAQSGKTPNLASLATATPIPVFEGVAVPHRAAPVTSHLTGGNQFAPAAAMSPQRTGPLSTHNTGGSGLGSSRVASHSTGGTQVATHTTGGPGRYEITPEERERFSAAFASCGPLDGTVSGDAARDLFMRSTLPVDQLGKIWSLVDTNSTGKLNLSQFTVAMYLITKLRQGVLTTIPAVVPADLWTSVNRSARSSSESISDPIPSSESPLQGLAPPPSARSLNRMSTMIPGTASPRVDRRRTMIGNAAFGVNTDWAVTAEEKTQFDQYFDSIDTSNKSFVTGQESYDLFLKAKLPQSELAKIWDLADIEKRGNLRREEFAVAMHLIRLRMAGGTLPHTLPADLVPPSMRGVPQASLGAGLPAQSNRAGSAEVDLMSDFGSAQTPQSNEPAGSVHKPVFEAPRSLSFSNIPSAHEVADFQSRERDLAGRKQDLQQVEQQIELLQPTVEELRQKRAEIDAEYKAATEKRNEMAMKLSQLRGVYETEFQITAELEQELRREQQMVEIGAAELQQAQQTVTMLTHEKENLEKTLQQTHKHNEDAKRLIAETTDAAAPLRIELEKLRAELHKQVQHRQVNDQLLESAQRDYQQVHGDVQIETANLEREKSRNLHVTQQIAVQSSINERERLRLQGIIAEKQTEAAKSQARPAAPSEAKGEINAAFANAGATSALVTTELPPAIQTRQPSVANGLASPSPVTPAAGTPAKKPPPRPPAAKKPERGQPLTPLHGAELPTVGNMTPENGKTIQMPLQKNLSTPKLSSSPAPVAAPAPSVSDLSTGGAKSSAPAAKLSDKDDFEALFESNKPTPRKSIDNLAATPNNVPSSPASALRTASPIPASVSPRTASVPLPVASSPGGKTNKGGFSLGFEPRKDFGEGGASGGKRSGSSSASVRSLPLLDKPDAAKIETPLSAPAVNSAQQLNVINDEESFSFSTAPGSLSALADTTVSTADLASGSAIAGHAEPASLLDREFGVGHADEAAGFTDAVFNADFGSAFPQATPAPPGSVSSDGQRPPPIEPVPDSRPVAKRVDSTLPEVDLEAEFKDAFADAQVAGQGSPSKLPAEFDDAAFAAGHFDDDAFSFDSSFQNFASPSKAGPTSANQVKPAEFEADFASAFAGGSDPFGASAFSFGAPLAKPVDFPSSNAAQMSAADMDALFGGGGSTNTSNLAPVNEASSAFDDAFAGDAFASAFGAPASSSPTKLSEPAASVVAQDVRPSPPTLPQRKETTDDAEEVKQIVALGFTKEQAVNALDINGFDVAKATNYLLDAK